MERAKPVWLEQRVRVACLNGTECRLGRGDLVHVFSLQGPEPSVFDLLKAKRFASIDRRQRAQRFGSRKWATTSSA
jgi:hypothetical protein